MKKTTDSVRALLTPKEAVLNRNAAELLGRDTIKRLNAHGNMLAKRGVDLASDPTPGPSTDNLLGYQMGTMSVGDDRGDLLRDADNTFYGGGQVPVPTPTPTPTKMYQYGTEDVRKRRTTDRYFRGINIDARPSRNAISGTPQGQTLDVGDSRFGYRSLPPDQNPAYQAALSRPRLKRGDLTTIQLPSGGTATVPSSSAGRTVQTVRGSQITQIGNQFPIDYAAQRAKGFGAPNPGIQQFAGGPALVQGGVANPIQNLTPQTRRQYGVGSFVDSLRASPVSQFLGNTFSTPLINAASRVANFFGGGNTPNLIPSANAGQPSPIPYQTPPPPTPTPTPTPQDDFPGYQYGTSNVMPRRYSDLY